MRHLFARFRKTRCTVHNDVEGPAGRRIYPFRCHRCGECFICGHKLIFPREAGSYWICADGGSMPTKPSPGVPVS